MAKRKADRTPPTAVAGEVQSGLLSQLRVIVDIYWNSPVRNRLILLVLGVFAIIIVTSAGQVLLNRWNVPFYDALSRRDLPAFTEQLMVFIGIASVLLVLSVAQTWLNQMTRLKLREGLTRDLIGEWLVPRRAFKLSNSGPIGVNPDQRLHEDARHLAEMSTDLGFGLLQASILMVSFVGVLWSLSSGFVFNLYGYSFSIPGYMVWAAILYAASASWLSWLVGRKLIKYNADRYQKESELRFSLMRVNEHIDAISLYRGEADEKRRLGFDVDSLLAAIRLLVTALTQLTWVTSGYGWFTIVAPILVAAPVYFAGNLSFGGLMMAIGAFNQVHAALKWFVDNFGAIADWRATLLRVTSFRQAVQATDIMNGVEQRIGFAEGEANELRLDALKISAPRMTVRLKEKAAVVKEGERVLITSETGIDRTLLFRAIAGLWPWGAGTVTLPGGKEIIYMPRLPYFPPGSLREAMSYPLGKDGFSDSQLVDALHNLGLKRLETMLDFNARWERELSDDEQQSLAFARLRLHKPDWVVIDEALDGMEPDARELALAVLRDDLGASTVVHIGREDKDDHVFSKVLHFVSDPSGHGLEGTGVTGV
ncbi:ABC transporter ATP-binding protein/permease [Phyllobacterium sp. 21LDTY02-6]|uniref:ABC transporter ATP-binding protein/permease n=1 Tax=unclassified Phyllobacterium TaxID=2638441 RepID=UPI00202298D7|nr:MULTISPECIES: ABC transporter ATP-binding protein/permease [unclassified Phyllobacterium]MCO4315859.1 ABC transporter ATP-binding protein/permease [Phyllobacterium sp. 21LDTY02-6]MCX8282282.1 ABC transporter ATP-binding protein/permease [Phyllobacterium sp. 0TCS1.6C]MCX8292092.1 ABC transporter ATP-binding protein/permease [Phyllobacterium sp. 0TCS1.6A]